MLLRWLVVVFFCLHGTNAAEDQTFYDFLVSQNASQQLIDFWREVAKIEGGYEKSMEMGFVPTFDEFSHTSYAILGEFFMLSQPEQRISFDQLYKMKIFNMTVVDEGTRDESNLDYIKFMLCVAKNPDCNRFLRKANEKFDVFKQTEKFLKLVRMTYPDVGLDMERFIEDVKKQCKLLKNDKEREAVHKIAEIIVYDKDQSNDSFRKVLKKLSKEEQADIWYNIFWFTRRVDKHLYENMLKLKKKELH